MEPMMTVRTAETVAERLADLSTVVPDLRLLVLFGSTAKGRARTGSDVDLGVACEGAADLAALHVAVAPRLGTERVDLVDLRRTAPLLAFEVARTGRVLFERQPGTFRAFQSLASRRYADSAKFRRSQRRALYAFLEREGLA
jgi:predicted nucleotidyltransferase